MVHAMHEHGLMGSAHILVADDDPVMIDDVASMLAAIAEVTRATTADELKPFGANELFVTVNRVWPRTVEHSA